MCMHLFCFIHIFMSILHRLSYCSFISLEIRYCLSSNVAITISLANTSDIIMNRSNHSKYSCFVIHFMGKALSLSSLNIMLAQVFHRCSLSSWKSSLLLIVYWELFLSNEGWILWNLFRRWFYCVPSLFCQCSILHWFTNVKLIFWFSEVNPTWSWNLTFLHAIC